MGALHSNRSACSENLLQCIHKKALLTAGCKKTQHASRHRVQSAAVSTMSTLSTTSPVPLPSWSGGQTRGSRTGPGATTERPWSDSEKSDSPLLNRRKPLPANHLRRLPPRIAREQERFWKHFDHIVGTGVRCRGLAGCHPQRLPLRVPRAKGPKAGHEPCRKQFFLRIAGA